MRRWIIKLFGIGNFGDYLVELLKLDGIMPMIMLHDSKLYHWNKEQVGEAKIQSVSA